jgi:hypothetical protein
MDAQDTTQEKLDSAADRPGFTSRSDLDWSDPDRPPMRPDQRSRITNHKDLLPGLDGRSASARRFRDLMHSYLSDMGGLEHCSEIKLGLLRRLAAATVQAELLEAAMVRGEKVDVGTLCTLASTAVRIASRVGLERVARPVDLYRDILPGLKHDGSNGADE